jgi:hypothetical protein
MNVFYRKVQRLEIKALNMYHDVQNCKLLINQIWPRLVLVSQSFDIIVFSPSLTLFNPFSFFSDQMIKYFWIKDPGVYKIYYRSTTKTVFYQ